VTKRQEILMWITLAVIAIGYLLLGLASTR
jgi:hypothetical protein